MANEQQKITLSASPQGGSYRITFDGQETGDIAYDANAAAVTAALEALSSVGSGNVSVGISGLEITITFTGSLGGANQPEITVTNNTLCRNTIETLSLSATPVAGSASVKAVGFGGSLGTVYYYDSASAIETALETAGYPSGTGVSGNWNPDGFTISTPADVTLDITNPSFEDAGTNPLTPSYVKTQSYSSVTATVSTIQDGSEPPIMIVHAPTGLTLTAKVFERGSDTLVETVTLTERTNCKGMYEGDLAANESGWHDLSIFSGATCVGIQVAYLTTNPVEHYAGDYCGIEDPSGLLSTVGPSLAGIASTVAATVPTNASIASTVAAAITADHGSGSYTTANVSSLATTSQLAASSAALLTPINSTATTATAINSRTTLLPTVAAGLAGGVLIGNGTGTVTLTSGGVVRANDANGAAIATATALATAQTSINTLATTTQLAASSAALLTQVNLAIATSAAILDDTGTSGVAVSAASKTGYKLAADGLDSISISDPGGIANYNTWPKYVVGLFRLMIGAKSEKSTAAGTIVSYADNGTTANLTMAYTSSGGIDTKGPAT